MDLDLPNATFIVDIEQGATVDPEAFRGIVESWGGYNYKVGEIEISV